MAHRIADELPEPLTYERLRGHRLRPIRIPYDEYLQEIATQFNLSKDQARQVVERIFHLAKKTLDDAIVRKLESVMPPEWSRAIKTS